LKKFKNTKVFFNNNLGKTTTINGNDKAQNNTSRVIKREINLNPNKLITKSPTNVKGGTYTIS
jgi:hypothetical protein